MTPARPAAPGGVNEPGETRDAEVVRPFASVSVASESQVVENASTTDQAPPEIEARAPAIATATSKPVATRIVFEETDMNMLPRDGRSLYHIRLVGRRRTEVAGQALTRRHGTRRNQARAEAAEAQTSFWGFGDPGDGRLAARRRPGRRSGTLELRTQTLRNQVALVFSIP